jgi:hypothetical protein
MMMTTKPVLPLGRFENQERKNSLTNRMFLEAATKPNQHRTKSLPLNMLKSRMPTMKKESDGDSEERTRNTRKNATESQPILILG